MKLKMILNKDFYFKNIRTLHINLPFEAAELSFLDIEKLFQKNEVTEVNVGVFDWLCCQFYFLWRKIKGDKISENKLNN